MTNSIVKPVVQCCAIVVGLASLLPAADVSVPSTKPNVKQSAVGRADIHKSAADSLKHRATLEKVHAENATSEAQSLKHRSSEHTELATGESRLVKNAKGGKAGKSQSIVKILAVQSSYNARQAEWSSKKARLLEERAEWNERMSAALHSLAEWHLERAKRFSDKGGTLSPLESDADQKATDRETARRLDPIEAEGQVLEKKMLFHKIEYEEFSIAFCLNLAELSSADRDRSSRYADLASRHTKTLEKLKQEITKDKEGKSKEGKAVAK